MCINKRCSMGSATYLTSNVYSGVWLSSKPLDANEGAFGDVLLVVVVNLPDDQISQYEWIDAGKGFREFLIPAALLNPAASIAVADVEIPPPIVGRDETWV